MPSSLPDRRIPPPPGPLRDFAFPPFERFRLDNGLEVLCARPAEPAVATATLMVRGGGAVDPREQAGTAALTAELLESGTDGMGPAEVVDRIESLGIEPDFDASWDACHAAFTGLSDRVVEGLDLLARLVVSPSFPADEVARIREEAVAGVRQRRANPRGLAGEAVAAFLYSSDSPFARPLRGTTGSLQRVGEADIRSFHARWFAPERAALVLVGPFQPGRARELADRHFGRWGGGDPGEPELPAGPRARQRQLVIVDRPGAVQSEIRVGHVGVARSIPDFFRLRVMNALLGGAFSSRLNLNLRERHGFTYGVHSGFAFRRLPGPFLVSTAVESAVTAAAVREILAELEAIRTRPPDEAEVEAARDYLAGAFPLRLQTTAGVAGRLAELAAYGLPDDYFAGYRGRLLAVSAEEAQEVARRHVRPDEAAVVVVGDAGTVRGPLEEACGAEATVITEVEELADAGD